MALLFSHVRVSTPDGNEAEFLVSGIPREFDDFEYYTAFEDFLDGIEEDTEISVHAEAYLYGEGETWVRPKTMFNEFTEKNCLAVKRFTKI